MHVSPYDPASRENRTPFAYRVNPNGTRTYFEGFTQETEYGGVQKSTIGTTAGGLVVFHEGAEECYDQFGGV